MTRRYAGLRWGIRSWAQATSPLDGSPSGDPGVAGRGADRDAGRLDVVGERDRRAVGGAGEGRGWPDRHERAAACGRRDLGRLEGDRSVAAGSVCRHEPVVEVLHRGLRMERQHRVLELVGPELGDDVRRDEDERITDRDLAAPDVRLEVGRRETALPVRVGQRGQAGLADQVRLRGSDRRDVHLVAADHGHAHPDRPVAVGGLEPEPVGLVRRAACWPC